MWNIEAELGQYSKLSTTKINGISCTQGEECSATMKTVGAKIKFPITEADYGLTVRKKQT